MSWMSTLDSFQKQVQVAAVLISAGTCLWLLSKVVHTFHHYHSNLGGVTGHAASTCNSSFAALRKNIAHYAKEKRTTKTIASTEAADLYSENNKFSPASDCADLAPSPSFHAKKEGEPEVIDSASIRVEEIFIYPIKSVGGTRHHSCEVTNHGIKWDRNWFLRLSSDGSYVSPDVCPALCAVAARVDEDRQLLIVASFIPPNTASREVAELKPLFIPLNKHPQSHPLIFRSVLNGIDTEGVDEGDEAASFFSTITKGVNLGEVRLIRVMKWRNANDKPWGFGPLAKKCDLLAGQCFGAVNILCRESIDYLEDMVHQYCVPTGNSKVDLETKQLILKAEQFRTNFVFKGAPRPCDEDTWDLFTVGGVEMRFGRLDARCRIINTGWAGKFASTFEPFRTLRRIRMTVHAHERDNPDAAHKPMFAVDCFVDGTGRISVGDDVRVQKRGKAPLMLPFKDR